MARACHDNASKLYLDSLALRKRKSRGHAYSLLVLSVEETVKALVYRLAVDGLIELSDKEKAGPIGLTEKDLLDHKVKHGILADVIVSSIVYSPFWLAFEGIKEKRIEVRKAKSIMVKAIALYQILVADLQNPNSQLSRHVRKFTEFLGNMNDEKNLGFYVDRREGLILKPPQISSSKYRYWQEFQEDFLESTRIMLREGVDPEIVQAFKDSRKVIVKRLRALKSKKDRMEKTQKQGVA